MPIKNFSPTIYPINETLEFLYFLGYLTKAELISIRRFVSQTIEKDDKTLITRTNLDGKGESFLIGHKKEEFIDWEDTYVI